jgi:hypothetical protein
MDIAIASQQHDGMNQNKMAYEPSAAQCLEQLSHVRWPQQTPVTKLQLLQQANRPQLRHILFDQGMWMIAQRSVKQLQFCSF